MAKGEQIRDWLYVERSCPCIVFSGNLTAQPGKTYNIGGHNERRNIDVVTTICELLEELHPNKPAGVAKYVDLITHVKDRPGHDLRYAIDAAKIAAELGWKPQRDL